MFVLGKMNAIDSLLKDFGLEPNHDAQAQEKYAHVTAVHCSPVRWLKLFNISAVTRGFYAPKDTAEAQIRYFFPEGELLGLPAQN